MDIWLLIISVALLVVALASGVISRRRPRRRNLTDSSPALLSSHRAVPEHATHAPEILLGRSAELPALTIKAWDKPIPDGAIPVESKTIRLDAFTPLLQAAPQLLTAAEIGTGHYMKVIVDGTLAASADGNFFPFARGASGQVSELAKLTDPTLLKRLINGAAAWQVASVIVAQKHLSDISKKLDEIVEKIDKINQFQLEERRSNIRGAMIYFKESAGVFSDGEFASERRSLIEKLYNDLTSAQDHLEKEIASLVAEISSLKGKDVYGVDDLYETMIEHVKRIDETVEDWLHCIEARVASWFLLGFFPELISTRKIRLRDIKDSAEKFLGKRGCFKGISVRWEAKIKEIRAIFNRESTLHAYRKDIQKRVERSNANRQDAIRAAWRLCRMCDAYLSELEKPVELLMRLEIDGSVKAYKLPWISQTEVAPPRRRRRQLPGGVNVQSNALSVDPHGK